MVLEFVLFPNAHKLVFAGFQVAASWLPMGTALFKPMKSSQQGSELASVGRSRALSHEMY